MGVAQRRFQDGGELHPVHLEIRVAVLHFRLVARGARGKQGQGPGVFPRGVLLRGLVVALELFAGQQVLQDGLGNAGRVAESRHAAALVYQHRMRDAENPESLKGRAGFGGHVAFHVMRFQEFQHLGFPLPGQRQENHRFVLELFRQAVEARDILHAGRAAGPPEFQHYRFPFEIFPALHLLQIALCYFLHGYLRGQFPQFRRAGPLRRFAAGGQRQR